MNGDNGSNRALAGRNGTGTSSASASVRPAVSVVVPTRNEAANVEPLLERLARVLPHLAVEILFVDDSDDDTPAVVERAGAVCARDVRLIHRVEGQRGDGLGGAVVAGILAARGDWVCVLDGDLQHPPELIADLYEEAGAQDADLVVASRFADGGSTGSFGSGRAGLSALSKAAAVALFPRRLRGVTDPMSGFFLVRKDAIRLERLRPRGFKILLEILVRTPGLRVAEVPFTFGERHGGESKASLREGLRFLAQLGVARGGDRGTRLAHFLAVGGSGLLVNTAVFAALVLLAHLHYLAAALLATQVSTAWNFLLTDGWVYRDRPGPRTRRTRTLLFFALNNAALAFRGPLLFVLVGVLGVEDVGANVLSLVALTLLRFGVSDSIIWGGDERPRSYAYDIHGLVSVESPVRLRELERFRTVHCERPTIRVRIGRLSRRQSELVAALAFLARHTRYDEGLGALGFGVEIARGRSTEVLASPLLAWSPHVLYTNVVEPIIRWALVQKGYALVHGACVADTGGRATLITARTDTGKTTTILRLLDSRPCAFLSDDLTVVDASGRVLTYPKPLTISSHTVAVVKTPLLSRRERAALKLQSRVHSRSGRRFAFLLTKSGLPVATINAIVQLVVPPPKYHVERLVPGVQTTTEAQLSRFVVIERGGSGEEALDPDASLETLMENSEDAFGFPPYPSIKEFLHGRNGGDLRERERRIVRAALASVPGTVLRSETMDWFERVPVGDVPPVAAPAAEPVFEGALAFEP